MILIALGANLPSRVGAPAQTLRAALAELAERGAPPAAVSRFFETQAWPDPCEPRFVNAVARVETKLDADELLELLHAVEHAFGRRRAARNAPRTLDLDLLDYEGRIQAGPPQLPHPRLETRGFVLLPLADVAPHWRHPKSGRTIAELVAALPDAERQIAITNS